MVKHSNLSLSFLWCHICSKVFLGQAQSPTITHSHSFRVANAHGPSPSQHEVSIIKFDGDTFPRQ